MARQNPFSPDEPLHECSRGYSIAHGYSSPVLPYYSSKQRPFFFPPATQAGVDPTLKTSIFTKPPPSTSLCSRASETRLHWHARCHLSVAVWLLQAQLLRVVETRLATLALPPFAVPLLLQQ